MQKRLLPMAIALAFSAPLYAQEVQTLPELLTQGYSPAPLASDAQARSNLQNTARQEGGDVLRQILGVDGARMGGHGIDPVIRGQSQTQLNVLLDGAYIHGGCPNRMDPPTSFANIETYDSVRVIQGVETLQYGTGGTGGTILFERAMPQMGTHGRIEAGAGDNGYQSSATAEVSHRGQQGYVRAFAVNKDGGNYKDGNGNTVRASFNTEHHGAILGLTPTATDRIEVSAEKIVTHNALFQGAGMDAPYDEAKIFRAKYWGKGFGVVDAIKAEVSYAEDEHLMDNYSLRTNPNPMTMWRASPTTANTLSGRLALTSHLSPNTSIDYGLNIQQVDRKATLVNPARTMTFAYNWPKASTDRIGIFAEGTHKLSEDSRIKAGIRADKVSAEADLFSAKPANSMLTPAQVYQTVYGYTGNNKVNEDHWSGLLRYEKDIAKDLTWFMGLSRTMRTADETERFFANAMQMPGMMASYSWVGNPGLNPEKHIQLDTGFTKQAEHYGWRANVFYDTVEDYILRDKGSNAGLTGALANTSVYRNVNAELYGAQAEGFVLLGGKTNLSGGLSYVHSKNTSDNRDIAQTPPLSGYISLGQQSGDYGYGARLRFQSKQTAIDLASGLDKGETAAWSVLDLYGSVKLAKQVKLLAGVDNIFNQAYYQHVGRVDTVAGATWNVYEPGRSAWLKLVAQF